jgi:Xaa-Pro aminopeptidase
MVTASEYESRRQRLFDATEEGSALLLWSGVPKVRSADEDYPFEVNRNFYYMTGIDQQGSALLLVNCDGERQEFLFVLPYDPNKEKWYGRRLTAQEALNISGVKNVLMADSLQSKLDNVYNENVREFGEVSILYLDLDPEQKIGEGTFLEDFVKSETATYSSMKVRDCHANITALRLRKSNREIGELRNAISITKNALQAVWARMRPGMKEYELADIFLHEVNDANGYQGLAFDTIMASGAHGTCLHYPTPLDTIPEGALLLSDLGARSNYYCADVTRTVPASGKFTSEQLDIYRIVLGCNEMIAKMAKPGVTIAELQSAAIEYLSRNCLEKGYIENKEDYIKYYYHNISHFIGLDTHDPVGAPNDRSAYKDIPLEPGMVISDEPGLYMADRGIGIRIEDDLLITDSGCEVLTKDIIKDPEEIEKFLASRGI